MSTQPNNPHTSSAMDRPTITIDHDEPIVICAHGNQLHDRIQVTLSVRQLWYVIEGLQNLRYTGLSQGIGDPTTPEAIGELVDQLAVFWVAFRDEVGSHGRAQAPALRLSNCDVVASAIL